jgi:hypothetical protein
MIPSSAWSVFVGLFYLFTRSLLTHAYLQVAEAVLRWRTVNVEESVSNSHGEQSASNSQYPALPLQVDEEDGHSLLLYNVLLMCS